MPSEFSKAMQGFSESLQKSLKLPDRSIVEKLRRIGSVERRASDIAEEKFPDSARDASTQNAFRHALGTGMLTNELGGGYVASQVAKGAGYLWEGLGAMDFVNSREHRDDTRHDLNANAIGAKTARQTLTNEELVKRLEARARNARTERPPRTYEPSPGYLTRSEE